MGKMLNVEFMTIINKIENGYKYVNIFSFKKNKSANLLKQIAIPSSLAISDISKKAAQI